MVASLFIISSDWHSTKTVCVEGLRKYFEQFGTVEACTIMRDGSGRSRCFAFLTFEDPASVNAVMVREHYLDGKIASTPFLVTKDMIVKNQIRLIPSGRFQDKNIKEHRSFSLAAFQALLRRSQCANIFLSTVRLSIRRSCWTEKPAEVKDSVSFLSRMRMLNLSLVSENWKLTENW